MPTYEYACTSCGHRFETVQSFSDPALTACPACRGTLRKVFGNVGIVLKGSGFYKTDSRNGASKGARKTKETASSSEGAASTETSGSKESSSTASSSGSPEKAAASTGS